MCAGCDAIDGTIARYRRLKGQVTDKQTHEASRPSRCPAGGRETGAASQRVRPPQLAASLRTAREVKRAAGPVHNVQPLVTTQNFRWNCKFPPRFVPYAQVFFQRS